MNFDFIPYKLNSDIGDFKNNIQYISSDNGVDLYTAKEGFIELLLGFPVSVTNLYFFEGGLITVYIHLGQVVEDLNKVKETLIKAIEVDYTHLNNESGSVYYWQDESQFLGLLIQQGKSVLLLYHSLNKFNVFSP